MNASSSIHDVKEVMETFSKDEVNTRLADGWILLIVVPDKDEHGLPRFKYGIGLTK